MLIDLGFPTILANHLIQDIDEMDYGSDDFALRDIGHMGQWLGLRTQWLGFRVIDFDGIRMMCWVI